MQTNIDQLAQLSSQQKRSLLAQVLQENRFSPKSETENIPAEYYHFELSPDYQKLQNLLQSFERNGQVNPYFTPHETINNDTTRIQGREPFVIG